METNSLPFASQQAESLFFAFQAPTRRRIIKLLIENNGSLTLQEIHQKLYPSLSKATISDNLTVLEQAGIIKSDYYAKKHIQRLVILVIKEFTIKLGA